MVKIAPSILSADFGNLANAVLEAEKGGADLLHIDVMDGQFVSNITIGPDVIKSIRNVTKLPFDVHLMISQPEKYIEDFVSAGSDIITVHVEATNHLHGTLQCIKKKGILAGVALNPSTPLSSVENVISDIDLITIMTVNPGFGGQRFIKTLLPKIKNTRDIIEKEGFDLELEVDGGINYENAKSVVEAGAHIMVAGSAVFKGEGTVSENIGKLKGSS
jgi:ribulose-phosphate 3-epimerase